MFVVVVFFFFFKQETAYEIRLSLVGSEMCIKDRSVQRTPHNARDALFGAHIKVKTAASRVLPGKQQV